MDANRDAQGGIQMILGAAEMLEQRGDESSTQRRFSEGDTGYYCMCRIYGSNTAAIYVQLTGMVARGRLHLAKL